VAELLGIGMINEPAFEMPWHAQLFALTVHLNELGRFEWLEWVESFSITLKSHGLDRELNGGDDYFLAWLETLENLLAKDSSVGALELFKMRKAWEAAHFITPHGAPVILDPPELKT